MSSPSTEVFRRTNLLFKTVDKLERLALCGGVEEDEDGSQKAQIEKDIFSHAGVVLRSLNEYKVRNLCGEAVYGAGLQEYTQGRVSEKKFSKNTLSGKLNQSGRKNWPSSSELSFFEPTITLERNSNRLRIYGDCTCTLAKEGSLCTHMAALMVAWVRKSHGFEEEYQSEKPEFERARQLVLESLKELVDCIEVSSRADDLEMLQKTYTKLRLWAEEVRGANGGSLTTPRMQPVRDFQLAIREFSGTVSYVSLAIMSAIESKYKLGATDLYNASTVSTFGGILESFVESVSYGKSASSMPAARSINKRQRKVMIARAETKI
ncbi:MAG: SWIM zinc finger family protein, partial [Rhabdochlamydiaceae bacterium]